MLLMLLCILVLLLMLIRHRQVLCGWLQGTPETTRLHFVELAAPPNKQSRAGRKGSLAQAQALSKAYSSLTGVMLALKQQRKQDQHNSRCVCSFECASTHRLHKTQQHLEVR